MEYAQYAIPKVKTKRIQMSGAYKHPADETKNQQKKNEKKKENT